MSRKSYSVRVTFGRTEEFEDTHDIMDADLFAAFIRPKLEVIFEGADFSQMKLEIVNKENSADSFSETSYGERLKDRGEG